MVRTLAVNDMNCTGCEQNVVDALSGLDGVENASADHESDTVAVEGDADEDDLREAIEEAGYTVEA
ncbi:copper exporting ATPase [Halalkalicoccus paucihalophilus]|uniref:Copper exporting ATPase n=1 Tax=Halalkalicoccus paucihalophilus TaxID=1008153 RepID=A0A151AD38_9EURY|nr:heavy metal-associated domain-containing protein [Halalkalicoccus paucihalophilus]KYH25470.1 copper exporting ATPase [Halalkalicoccus paucihalophilus]